MIKMKNDVPKDESKCLIGLAIGDALGEPFEGYPAPQIEKIWKNNDFFKNPEITDDTILTILVAESIIEQKDVIRKEIAKKIISNEKKLRRIGPSTSNAIRMLKSDVNVSSSVGTTNGAAMRASPIGLFCCNKIIEKTVEASKVTHGTDVAVSGACCISLTVDAAIKNLDKDDCINACIKGAREGRKFGTQTDFPKIDELIEVALNTPAEKLPGTMGVGIQTHESVPCAISIFYNTKNFKEAVISAVRLGGDTDTIASMVGAISGAFYKEVPDEWRFAIGEREYLEYLERELLELKKAL